MANGSLGKVVTRSNAFVEVYTVPVEIDFATLTIQILNRGSSESSIKIAIIPTTSGNPNNTTVRVVDYIEDGTILDANGGRYEGTCIVLGTRERIMVSSSVANLVVDVRGLEKLL